MQNFNQIGLGVSVLRMRDFAPGASEVTTLWRYTNLFIIIIIIIKVTWLFFLVLEKGYSRDACTDFDAKYVKRRGSAQGSAFWGPQKQNLRFRSPFSPKTTIFGPHFDRTYNFFARKRL